MEGPSLGFNCVNFESVTFATKFLGRKMDSEINRTQDWVNLQAEINSDSRLCHGPEDGDSDQSLVVDATEPEANSKTAD